MNDADNRADGESRRPEESGQGQEGGQQEAQSAESRENALLAELKETRRELEHSRTEQESVGRKLEEIARAYSALVNDQKDFRARLEREKERVLENERGKVAIELLEIGDELDRALVAADGDQSPLAQGVRMIRQGLTRQLGVMGIERMALVGQPFDPNLAEAVELVPVQDRSQDEKVLSEALPGYRLGERVLRAARVSVARYLEPAGGAAGEPSDEPQI